MNSIATTKFYQNQELYIETGYDNIDKFKTPRFSFETPLTDEELKNFIKNKIEQHFKIIEIYSNDVAKQNLDLFADLPNRPLTGEVNQIGSIDKHIHTTDIHGDLGALLYNLVADDNKNRNPARFRIGEETVVFFNLENGSIESDLSLIPKENRINLVPIPNLELNPDFMHTFTLGGDLIDRGDETESCFYTMVHLLNEQTKILERYPDQKPKIYFIMGNHEQGILHNKVKFSIVIGFNTTFTQPRLAKNKEEQRIITTALFNANKDSQTFIGEFNAERFAIMQDYCLKLVKHNQMILCYLKEDVIISHVFFAKQDVIDLINEVVPFTSIMNFTANDINSLAHLQNKISYNIPLTIEDMQLLVNKLNHIMKTFYTNEILKTKELSSLMIELVSNRILNLTNNEKKSIVSLKQIIGHDITTVFSIQNLLGYTYLSTDFSQSNNYNIEDNETRASKIIFEKGVPIQNNYYYCKEYLNIAYKSYRNELQNIEESYIESLNKDPNTTINFNKKIIQNLILKNNRLRSLVLENPLQIERILELQDMNFINIILVNNKIPVQEKLELMIQGLNQDNPLILQFLERNLNAISAIANDILTKNHIDTKTINTLGEKLAKIKQINNTFKLQQNTEQLIQINKDVKELSSDHFLSSME